MSIASIRSIFGIGRPCGCTDIDMLAKDVAMRAKAAAVAKGVLENSLPAAPIPSLSVFGCQEVVDLIREYSSYKDVLKMQRVSSGLQGCVASYLFKYPLPAWFSAGTNPAVFMRYFTDAIDPGVIAEHLGEVGDVPPVPKHFIDQAQEGFKLIYIPKFITIEVDENSPLFLDNTTAVNGKKARLRVSPNPVHLVPTGKMRKMTVPVTVHNLITLALKCQRGANLPSWCPIGEHIRVQQSIRDQHGDVGVEPHWSYQKDALRIWFPEITAWFRNVRKVSLIDRLFFDFLVYMRSGTIPHNKYAHSLWHTYHEVTSTTVKGERVMILWDWGHDFSIYSEDENPRSNYRWPRSGALGGYAEEISPQSPGGVV